MTNSEMYDNAIMNSRRLYELYKVDDKAVERDIAKEIVDCLKREKPGNGGDLRIPLKTVSKWAESMDSIERYVNTTKTKYNRNH